MTRIAGNVNFNAPMDHTWRFLTSPHHLSHCLPGLVVWEVIEPDKKFHLRVRWGANEKTEGIQIPVLIEWVELTPPQQMELAVHVLFGGTPITGAGSMNLSPLTPTQTELSFMAELLPPSKILDQLIRNTAPKLIDTFFKCCKESLEMV